MALYGATQKNSQESGHHVFRGYQHRDHRPLSGVSYSDVFHRMERLGMIDDYILPNYEPLHSESRDVLAQRMVECLNNWEAKL